MNDNISYTNTTITNTPDLPRIPEYSFALWMLYFYRISNATPLRHFGTKENPMLINSRGAQYIENGNNRY